MLKPVSIFFKYSSPWSPIPQLPIPSLFPHLHICLSVKIYKKIEKWAQGENSKREIWCLPSSLWCEQKEKVLMKLLNMKNIFLFLLLLFFISLHNKYNCWCFLVSVGHEQKYEKFVKHFFFVWEFELIYE